MLFKEIKGLNQEVLEQAEEHSSAKEVLVKAKDELDKVLQSKKLILIHLQKALLKLEEKNKMLVTVREAEHDKSEENLKKTAELLGMEKEIQKVNKLSALWDEVLENLRKEMEGLKQEKMRLEGKMGKLANNGEILNKATSSTEDQIKEIERELSKKWEGLNLNLRQLQVEFAGNRESNHEILHSEKEEKRRNCEFDFWTEDDFKNQQNHHEKDQQGIIENRGPPN